jgi:diguanylate cyclase (GGDEF)-like protein
MGVASVFLTTYYYLHQREYAQQYKTVINAFLTIQSDYQTLSYDILKSALYGYNNQDDIAQGVRSINDAYGELFNAPLFSKEQYLALEYPLIDLGSKILEYNYTVDHYLMLNAGIKNSFLFLLDYSTASDLIFGEKSGINNDIHAIISQLSDMRRLLEERQLSSIKQHLQNIQNFKTSSSEQKLFVETLTLHINYIQANFPDFITVITKLQDKEIDTSLSELRNTFNRIAQDDFVIIDRLAVLLLALIISALVTIITLLLRSQRENIRLKSLQKELEYLANFDTLTGLLNRNSFNRTLALKSYKEPTLLLININSFKHINDLYGSEIGDYVLQSVSQLIKLPLFDAYKPSYYRFGGDDFGVLLETITGEKAYLFSEAVIRTVKEHLFIDNEIEFDVTVNIAINSLEPLLENADMVLKHHKKIALEPIVVFAEEFGLKEQIQNNINILQSLSSAIDQKRIVPFFQPIIELQSGKIVKYEALVRQISTAGKVIEPDRFLKLAAQTPLYRELTKMMIEQVFAAFESEPFRFSINLSMRDLLDSELMQMLEALLKSNPKSAPRLEIELLESENLTEIDVVKHFISLLKGYGCRIAIDDFGTGYSNFSHLAKLSVDTLKIDGSLIRRIESDEKYLQTVQTIVRYADALGVETVAEFVETKETALKLKAIGVTYGQGYYFAPPDPAILQKKFIL